mgnify:FL=1
MAEEVSNVAITAHILRTSEGTGGLSEANLDDAIQKYPRVEGSDKQYLTNDANQALSRAKKSLKDFGDEFISLELIIYGILTGKDKGAQILKDLGVTTKNLKEAIAALRKGSKVTSQSGDGEW